MFINPLLVIVFIPQNNDKVVEELQQEVSQLTTSLRSAQAENGSLNSEVCVYTCTSHVTYVLLGGIERERINDILN